ncbi:MAG: hypothetical protein CMH97_04025 [Oceanospirillaceae bacterium]|nr:hypothetical protein [Oceanospirillaceae bacterium]|tara:strand:+ start:1106 stop:1999 length:894 start_codon:yes stop_codon:yes gene_type:complete
MFKRLFASHKNPYVPGLDNPERVSVSLAGCKLDITLPPHYSSAGFDADVEPKDIPNIYERSIYDYGHEYEDNKFSYANCIRRNWEFFGPIWKFDSIGMTDFQVTSLRVDCLPEGMSCFNPAILEQVVMRYLYETGPAMPDYGRKLAPVNWQVEIKQGNPWILFEQHKDLPADKPEEHEDSNFKAFAVTALDDHYILFLRFINFGSMPVAESIEAANKVRDLVIGSIHWQLSDHAEERKQEVISKYPSTSITPDRQPATWRYPAKWRDGIASQGETRAVILEPGDPAPEFHIEPLHGE